MAILVSTLVKSTLMLTLPLLLMLPSSAEKWWFSATVPFLTETKFSREFLLSSCQPARLGKLVIANENIVNKVMYEDDGDD